MVNSLYTLYYVILQTIQIRSPFQSHLYTIHKKHIMNRGKSRGGRGEVILTGIYFHYIFVPPSLHHKWLTTYGYYSTTSITLSLPANQLFGLTCSPYSMGLNSMGHSSLWGSGLTKKTLQSEICYSHVCYTLLWYTIEINPHHAHWLVVHYTANRCIRVWPDINDT
jgi:hypothetical protein